MNRQLRISALSLLALAVGTIASQTAQSAELSTIAGKVQKVEKESLLVGGPGSKPLSLKLTGTSNLTSLSTQNRSDKLIAVQRRIEASSLKAGQSIAVIYTVVEQESIVLSAVVLPVEKKAEAKTSNVKKPEAKIFDLKRPIVEPKPVPKK